MTSAPVWETKMRGMGRQPPEHWGGEGQARGTMMERHSRRLSPAVAGSKYRTGHSLVLGLLVCVRRVQKQASTSLNVLPAWGNRGPVQH